ncbi:MAG: diguanylate cyclase/phosphodiesterase (GGDEF & EAL domains) with PAS/PAC sensor(s) [uncultured Rubrobacteraceae bacterium]|uniref:Diguanylate cyclase/phosphodiesterase (GGDEF & EAL domains) with PAS/PAC sensor(S) n=1 Tax=uncultured Rubrobacteraceae bacterium TaxID=349277 RepID=A0A6J4RBU7_9ACTN|nr:MAG: diguanylate cyclase/phosphodiesterase (GGDEF & EAL domains) with PAS/PAC sensor(s) [uncultured Rubrobacteraceae bacterium]
MENSSEIVSIVDPDGTLRYANLAWGRVLGYDPEEIVGTNVLVHVHPDDLSHVLEETEKALSEVGVVRNRVEYRFRHKDGSWRWIESVGTYLLGDPAVGGVVVSSRDITRRKRAEEEIYALRREYEELVGSVEAIIWKGEARTLRFTFVSDQAEAILGYATQRWTREPSFWQDHIHPEDREWAVSFCRKAVAEKKDHDFEYRMISADGRVVWLRDIVRVGFEDGVPSQLFGVMVDITERKWAQEEFERLGRQNELILDSAGEGIFGLDARGNTTFANPAAARMLGWDAKELVGRSQHEIIHHTRPDGTPYPKEECPIYEALADGKVHHVDGETFWRKDGMGFPVEYTSTPIQEGGEVIGAVVTFRDVTERRRAEEALRRSEEHFRSLIRNASDIVTLYEADGTVRYASPALERVLGYEPAERVGALSFELIHPDDVARAREAFADILRGPNQSVAVEVRARHRDGSWRHLQAVGTNLLDDPSVGAIVLNGRDITERKEAEEALREAEERYRTLVEQIPAVSYIDWADGSDRPLYTSPQIEEMLGYTPEEWLEGRLWTQRLHPGDRERILAADERFEAGGGRFDEEYRLLARDGSVVWVREQAVLVKDEAGEPLYWQGVLFDMTERKEAEEAVQRSATRLAEAQRLAHLGGWEWDIRTGEISWSDEAYRIYGLSPQELVPSFERFMEIVHPDDRELLEGVINGALDGHRAYDVEHRIVRPGGEVRVVHRQAGVVRGEGGEPLRMVGTVHDVTERKTLEGQLEHRALHDPLTDLPNRTLFVDRLEQALRRARRQRGRKVAVLFVDLDNFKVVNDSLGHKVGDSLLAVLAERVRWSLRPGDTLARFGGDEFTVLVEDIYDPADAVQVAERITAELRRPFVLEGRELFASASIGIALGESATKGTEDLLRDADTAMYRAKEERSGYCMFDPKMYERAVRRLELENDLRKAVESGEFAVLYQPIVRLETGETWGLEALARWDHPRRGLLDPSEFVPVAEESGLIIPIGNRVLEEACRRTKGWQDRYPRTPPLILSVNLSAKQLRRPELAETTEYILRETGLDAGCLTLDVTETVYIKALEGNTPALDGLKKAGVRISVDDFGVGYSSLSYLKRLPADILKIDRSFTAGLGEDIEDTAIVRMVIELAHTFSMKVVAEGVESEEQAASLREMGCDMAQGYHFARPLRPEEVPGFLAR